MMSRITLIVFLTIFGHAGSVAQTLTTQYLSIDSFLTLVKNYHPAMRLATIAQQRAEAERMLARSFYDPKFSYYTREKTFVGKNYYQYSEGSIKSALPIGQFSIGLASNGGNFLNPETTAGRNGIAEFELPLLKGLVFDAGRSALRQAKINISKSELDAAVIRNEIMAKAYKAYWNWSAYYNLSSLYEKFLNNATQRLSIVKTAFQNGDRSVLDTVEASVQVLQYSMERNEVLIKLTDARLALSEMLWTSSGISYQLNENVVPSSESKNILAQMTADINEDSFDLLNTPQIKTLDLKIGMLEVERKLKRQNLLPEANFKFAALNRGLDQRMFWEFVDLSINNRWAFEVTVPLFLRKERAGQRLTDLKLKEAQLERRIKVTASNNEYFSLRNELKYLLIQARQNEEMQQKYASLLRAEEMKLSQGETSLFMINSREIKLIESLKKQIELTLRLYDTRVKLDYLRARFL